MTIRATTLAADRQLALPIEETASGAEGWAGLPEQARAAVLVLLARLIARGVLIFDSPTGEDLGDGGSHG
jgi:hypothetical protein